MDSCSGDAFLSPKPCTEPIKEKMDSFGYRNVGMFFAIASMQQNIHEHSSTANYLLTRMFSIYTTKGKYPQYKI